MSTEDNVLSVATAPAHVATLLAASKTSPFEPMASLVATEISDGNLNFAFCVADAAKPQCAVFLKQAPGYIKVLGPDYELSAARLNLEAEVLQAYSAAAPQHVPRLLARDEQFCTMVTEYLHGHELMRTALRERRCGVSAAEAVSQFMALTHASTWAASPAAATTAAATPSPSAWAHLTNESMCGITAAYVFSKPLDAADETNKSSPSLVSEAAALRGDQAFVNGVTRCARTRTENTPLPRTMLARVLRASAGLNASHRLCCSSLGVWQAAQRLPCDEAMPCPWRSPHGLGHGTHSSRWCRQWP